MLKPKKHYLAVGALSAMVLIAGVTCLLLTLHWYDSGNAHASLWALVLVGNVLVYLGAFIGWRNLRTWRRGQAHADRSLRIAQEMVDNLNRRTHDK